MSLSIGRSCIEDQKDDDFEKVPDAYQDQKV